MDSSFGNALERMFFWRMVMVCLVSAGLGIGGFLFIRYLIHHIAIHWK